MAGGSEADDFFSVHAAAALDSEQVPSPSMSESDPAWSSLLGVRARRSIAAGQAACVVAFLIVGANIAFLLAFPTVRPEPLAPDAYPSVATFAMSGLVLVAVVTRWRDNELVRLTGRIAAFACLIVAIAQLPLMAEDSHLIHFGSAQIVLGPAGPRSLLAFVIFSTALLVSVHHRNWARFASVAVIAAVGFAAIELVAWAFGADRVYWLGSPIGLPPATALVIGLLGAAVLFIRPDQQPLLAALKAGKVMRAYWFTYVMVFGVASTCALSVRLMSERGLSWPTAATYGWTALLVGLTIVFLLRGSQAARRQMVSAGIQAQLEVLAENASDVVLLTNDEGRCVWVSESLSLALGWEPDDWIGHSITEFQVSRGDKPADQVLHPSEHASQVYEAQFKTAVGDATWMSCRVKRLSSEKFSGEFSAYSLRNIDAEVAGRSRLKASESRLRIALDSSPVATALLDSARQITQANRAFCRLVGESIETLHGRNIDDVVKPEEEVQRSPNIVGAATRGSNSSASANSIFPLVAKGGRHVWCECDVVAMPETDAIQAAGFVCQIRDVTDEILDREELEFRAAHDRLTGLFSREALEHKMSEVMQWSPRSGDRLGLLFCDIDDFKTINDSYGHKAGDLVLKMTSDRIARAVRPNDFVARIGGDEIIVLLDGVRSTDDCVKVGDVLRKAVSKPLNVDGQTLRISMSFGAAIAQDSDTAEQILERADAALYHAKNLRKSLFDPV